MVDDDDVLSEDEVTSCCDGVTLLLARVLLFALNMAAGAFAAFLVYIGVQHQSYVQVRSRYSILLLASRSFVCSALLRCCL